MNRRLTWTILTVSLVSLTLSVPSASAQQPLFVAWQPHPAAMGTRLSQTAAYPTGPVYYPTAAAIPAYPGSNLYYRVAQAEPDPAAPANAPQTGYAPQSGGQPTYGYVECQCERCRRARGEYPGETGVLGGLWELERRKNTFLKRVFFGD